MSTLTLTVRNIEAILFDMNGTLRRREPHEPTQTRATRRFLELLGKNEIPDSYWEELTARRKHYNQWAQDRLIQLSEDEIWTRWILPEYPSEQIGPVAAELTLAWSERKGHTVPTPGAEQMLFELKRRGYRLGVISNTMSSLDIPRDLGTFGWNQLFEVVILSSTLKHRKPAPEPFLEALRVLKVDAAHCAYLGNHISKDIVGCKRAGFGLGIIVEPANSPHADERDQVVSPEAIIHSLNELLEIFPMREPD
jgi:putative hydrolase of the HAD superfamily